MEAEKNIQCINQSPLPWTFCIIFVLQHLKAPQNYKNDVIGFRTSDKYLFKSAAY